MLSALIFRTEKQEGPEKSLLAISELFLDPIILHYIRGWYNIEQEWRFISTYQVMVLLVIAMDDASELPELVQLCFLDLQNKQELYYGLSSW